MLRNRGQVVCEDLTGGINTKDPAHAIGDDQAVDLRNIEFSGTKFARRRNGSTKLVTGALPWGGGTSLLSLIRHTPTGDETGAQLFGVSSDATPRMARIAAGTSWSAALTLADNIDAAQPAEVYGASLNGKLFLTYKSAVDRLHVWDGTSVRRAGLPKPGTPTVANTGAGAYAAVKRWYKVQWVNTSVSPFIRGELSDAASFTPSGAGTAARVTRPALPGEHETTWIVLGSPDNVNFYVLGAIAAATTTFDDSVAPSVYATTLPTLTGFPAVPDYYTAPPSAKYVIADSSRILLAGSWVTAAYQSRIWWTPVLRTSSDAFSIADDERLPSGNFLDLNPQEGGDITGFGGPIDGIVYVFKRSQIYKLVRTGDLDDPYVALPISKVVGAIHQKTIFVGDDDTGSPCIYFLSSRGPYRLGPNGSKYLGRDIEPIWATVDQPATLPPHGVYYRDKGQVWYWVQTGGAGAPTLKLKFHVEYGRRDAHGRVVGGWTVDDGYSAFVTASVMFAETLGATMALKLRPWGAQTSSGGEIYMHDATAINRDANDTQAFIASGLGKAYAFAGLGKFAGIDRVYLQGTPLAGGNTIRIGLTRDFGAAAAVTRTTTLTPEGGATRCEQAIEGLEIGQCRYLQVSFGDPSAQNTNWTIDAIALRVRGEDPL